MGSYTVVGCHSPSSLTSEIMAAARDGEQMKWMTFDRDSLLLDKSRGVMRSLGVRYSNLLKGKRVDLRRYHRTTEEAGLCVPSMFPSVYVHRSSCAPTRVIPVKPYVRSVRVQSLLYVFGKVMPSVDDHPHFRGRKPVGIESVIGPLNKDTLTTCVHQRMHRSLPLRSTLVGHP